MLNGFIFDKKLVWYIPGVLVQALACLSAVLLALALAAKLETGTRTVRLSEENDKNIIDSFYSPYLLEQVLAYLFLVSSAVQLDMGLGDQLVAELGTAVLRSERNLEIRVIVIKRAPGEIFKDKTYRRAHCWNRSWIRLEKFREFSRIASAGVRILMRRLLRFVV